MKKFICFAAGPLHLMCIKELKEKNKDSIFEVYILKNNNKLIMSQLLQTLKVLDIKDFKFLNFSNYRLLRLFQNIKFKNYIKKNSKNHDLIFVIIDFRNSFLHYLRSVFLNSRFVLIDDGSSTYMNFQRYILNKHYLPFNDYKSISGYIKKIFLYKNQFRYLLYKEFEIFTFYAKELGLRNSSFNNFNSLKKILSNRARNKYDDKLVYFSGTKLVERNAMTLEQEVILIKKINRYWKKKGKHMIYIAKRSTSVNKIDILKNNSIDCLSYDLPLELALSLYNLRKIPSHFCSFGSTLDKTLTILYPRIKVYLVIFNKKNLKHDLILDLEYSKEMMNKSKNPRYIAI